MSREDAQFKLRLPAELREQVEQSAKTNRRSINAEIVARLEESFPGHFASEGDAVQPALPFSEQALERAVLKAMLALEGRLALRESPTLESKPKG